MVRDNTVTLHLREVLSEGKIIFTKQKGKEATRERERERERRNNISKREHYTNDVSTFCTRLVLVHFTDNVQPKSFFVVSLK